MGSNTPEHQACEVPLTEQLRSVPKDYRTCRAIQWDEAGNETGHQFIPVGVMMHRAAAELEQAHDIRADREATISLIAESLGVTPEPHQTFFERLIEAASRDTVQSETAPSPHALTEQDTLLLGAHTSAKTMAPGYEIEYWNLTMVRMKGDVVLTVRLPSTFNHYVENNGERLSAWNSGVVSRVRFTRELWRSFVEQIGKADTVFTAADELDALI